MKVDVGEARHGFLLTRKEFIDELKSEALLWEHQKTGAELLVMENDDDNKVFSITFRTPPGNDTGVAHIMEHSVLCGSEKFPVKEPFVELLKSSLQTFLNAMTFPDKTMYPVASRNAKDFFNLMDVYLDAVFFPRITPETFMQEGWHYELEERDAELTIKGVVFNEMKGVFSSPENVLDRHLAHSLFPKTTYGYESGGDPKAIPELTYSEFKEFHKKHYHPSNSRIFIYGDQDTDAALKFMDAAYLSRFERAPVETEIPFQRKFSKPKKKNISYAVSKGESLEKKSFVVMGLKLGKAVDHEHCLSMEILSHILLGTSASPLRKALMDSELGTEVIGGGFDDNRAETLFAVGLKGTDPDKENAIIELVDATLQCLVKDGIDPDMVKASVNTMEFKLREANYGGFPKGIVYNIQALGSWLYGADALVHLRYEALMKKIRRKSTKGLFENLIQKFLLDNKHRSIVVLVPKPGMEEKDAAKTRKQLRGVKATLDEQALGTLVEKTRMLQEMQVAPDPPEALATLPSLALDDCSKTSEAYPLEIKDGKGPKILFHDLYTNKIAYTQMCFDTHTVPREKIQYLPLLGRLVLGMGTRQRDYTEISKQIGIHTGGISGTHYSTATLNDRNSIVSSINFSGTVLVEKRNSLFELMQELLTERSFENHKRLLEILRSTKANMEASIVPHGNQYVLARLQSYSSPLGWYDEVTDGFTYYRFLEELLERAEKDPAEVASDFEEVAKLVFTHDNLLVNLTTEAKDYDKLERPIKSLSRKLPKGNAKAIQLDSEPATPNEAFLTTSTVQYVGKGANLYDMGFEFSGSFDVVKALLRTGYLWDHVRVQGGAYGCSVSFDYYTGDLAVVSYRDPNMGETLEAIDGISSFLSNVDLSGKELEKIIIGTVGHLDPPLTPDRKGAVSKAEYLTGQTLEWKQKRRDELFATTIKTIRGYSELFQSFKDKGRVCVLGNEGKIKKEKSHFDHLIQVFR